MKITIVFSFVLLLQNIFGSTCQAQNRVPGTPLKPLAEISGADSHIKKPFYKRVLNQKECNSIWANHLGTTAEDAYRAQFEVDFDRCMVVMVFLGDDVNTRGIELHDSTESKDSIVLRVLEIGYQTAGEDNKKKPDRPYALVVLPRSTKQIVLERGIQPLKNIPAQYQEFARL